MSLLGAIGALGSLAGLLKFILGLFDAQQQREAGASIEAGAVAQASAQTEVRIAQAAADAPRTTDETISAWEAGTA